MHFVAIIMHVVPVLLKVLKPRVVYTPGGPAPLEGEAEGLLEPKLEVILSSIARPCLKSTETWGRFK